MKTKHTPGIWFVNTESQDVGDGKLSVEVEGDYFIAQVDEGVCQEANARLISAAPEMLDALRYMMDVIEFSGNASREALDKARNAIAKAQGETK